MAVQTETKANVAYKRILGKGHTSNRREHFNEPYSSSFTLTSAEIFGDAIDPDPNAPGNAGVVSDLVTLELEPAVGVDTAYLAKIGAVVPPSLVGVVNPVTGLPYAAGDRVGHIVPERFGKDFRPILKDDGTEIFPLDASDWFVDAFAGIVTQEDDADSPLLNLGNTGTLDCYVYIGRYVLDRLGGGSATGTVRTYAFNAPMRVPSSTGLLYLRSGDVPTSAAPIVVTAAADLRSSSIRVNSPDPSRSYMVEFMVNGAVVDTLSIASGNDSNLKTTMSGSVSAGDEIAVRMQRTGGSGRSTFRRVVVTLDLAET